MPTKRAPSWRPEDIEQVIAELESINQEVVQVIDAGGQPLIVTKHKPRVGRPPKAAETR
jgi:organic radical activating enzyme